MGTELAEKLRNKGQEEQTERRQWRNLIVPWIHNAC